MLGYILVESQINKNMKNLRPYDKNSFDFFNSIVSSKSNTKKDPNYLTRLKDQTSNIEKKFLVYGNLFDANDLETLESTTFSKQEKDDLLALYSYKSKKIQELKIKLTTSEHNRILNTCQNCTINEVNSFDHLVPKDLFPEFSVNPKNLFPSCTQCNSHKSITWLVDKKRVFLNLFLDILPVEQFLFVDITMNNDLIVTNFFLDNRNNIEENMFRLIFEHYERLNLCHRFKINIDQVITPLKNSMKSNLDILTIDQIVSISINSANLNSRSFGANYWKSILENALLINHDFIKSI